MNWRTWVVLCLALAAVTHRTIDRTQNSAGRILDFGFEAHAAPRGVLLKRSAAATLLAAQDGHRLQDGDIVHAVTVHGVTSDVPTRTALADALRPLRDGQRWVAHVRRPDGTRSAVDLVAASTPWPFSWLEVAIPVAFTGATVLTALLLVWLRPGDHLAFLGAMLFLCMTCVLGSTLQGLPMPWRPVAANVRPKAAAGPPRRHIGTKATIAASNTRVPAVASASTRLWRTSIGKAPADWLALTTRCRSPLIVPNASRSRRHPLLNWTWLIRMVAQPWQRAGQKLPATSAPSSRGSANRTSQPRWMKGSVTVGNSRVSVTTGPSCWMRSATALMPADVFVTKAISSGAAFTSRATAARTCSRRSSQLSQCRSPSSSSCRW